MCCQLPKIFVLTVPTYNHNINRLLLSFACHFLRRKNSSNIVSMIKPIKKSMDWAEGVKNSMRIRHVTFVDLHLTDSNTKREKRRGGRVKGRVGEDDARVWLMKSIQSLNNILITKPSAQNIPLVTKFFHEKKIHAKTSNILSRIMYQDLSCPISLKTLSTQNA